MKPNGSYNELTVDDFREPLLFKAHAKLEFIFIKILCNTKHVVH